jgi:hypothetical protein
LQSRKKRYFSINWNDTKLKIIYLSQSHYWLLLLIFPLFLLHPVICFQSNTNLIFSVYFLHLFLGITLQTF